MKRKPRKSFFAKYKFVIANFVSMGVIFLAALILSRYYIPSVAEINEVSQSVSSVGLVVDNPRLGMAVVDGFTKETVTTLDGNATLYVAPDTKFDVSPNSIVLGTGGIYLENDTNESGSAEIALIFREFEELDLAQYQDHDGQIATSKLLSTNEREWLRKFELAITRHQLIEFGEISAFGSSKTEVKAQEGKATFSVHEGGMLIFNKGLDYLVRLKNGERASFSYLAPITPDPTAKFTTTNNWWRRKNLVVTDLLRFGVGLVTVYVTTLFLALYLINQFILNKKSLRNI